VRIVYFRFIVLCNTNRAELQRNVKIWRNTLV